MTATVSLYANAWEGTYRSADNPTVTIVSSNGSPIGATSWTVYNSKGTTVATGACSLTAASITVATGGVWASGGTVTNDFYFFATNTSVPSVSGGGVTTWNQASAVAANGQDVEIWWGVVTAPGANQLYVAGIPTQTYNDQVNECASGLASPNWSQIATNPTNPQVNSASTAVAFPALTATQNGQMYMGATFAGSLLTAGSTSGYVYSTGFNSAFGSCAFCYDLNLTVGSTSPTMSQASADPSYTSGVILQAAGTGSLVMSHVNQWNATTSSGTNFYSLAISPAAVGNVLVFCHVANAGDKGGLSAATPPAGCRFFVGSNPHGFDPTAAGYTPSTTNPAWCAWTGTMERNGYEFGAADNPATDAAAIAALVASDPAFVGPGLDSARPRALTIGTSTQSGFQSPTAAQWGNLAAAMKAQGASTTGATYELPVNEFEFAGWTQAQVISAINSDQSAILAGDSTAKVLGPCTAGVYTSTSAASIAAILAATALNGTSGHHENSYANQPDLVSLTQDLGGIASLVGSLAWYDTETGNYETYVAVAHPRRHARHCSLFAIVRESYGFSKESLYFFDTIVGQNPVDYSGLVERIGNGAGSWRGGAVALHVLSDALYGTACSVASPPSKLNFGSAGSPGASHFLGLHYASPGLSRDIVLLASNLVSDTVTLNVGSAVAASAATARDGFGVPVAVTTSGSKITVPTDDLVTQIFLPLTTAVSVVDTGSKLLSVANPQAAANLLPGATSLANEASGSVAPVGHKDWGYNWTHTYNIPGPGLPYFDATIPATIISNGPMVPGAYLFVLKSVPPWNPQIKSVTGTNYGAAAPIAFQILATIAGVDTVVYSYANATAVTNANVPSTPGASPATATTWWDHAFAWAGTFTLPSNATALKLKVTQSSVSGEPDATAAALSNTAGSFNTANQSAQIAEWQVFPAWTQPGGGYIPTHEALRLAGC